MMMMKIIASDAEEEFLADGEWNISTVEIFLVSIYEFQELLVIILLSKRTYAGSCD